MQISTQKKKKNLLIFWLAISSDDDHLNMLLYLQSSENLKLYYVTCYSLIAGIILFGGLLAPTVISLLFASFRASGIF